MRAALLREHALERGRVIDEPGDAHGAVARIAAGVGVHADQEPVLAEHPCPGGAARRVHLVAEVVGAEGGAVIEHGAGVQRLRHPGGVADDDDPVADVLVAVRQARVAEDLARVAAQPDDGVVPAPAELLLDDLRDGEVLGRARAPARIELVVEADRVAGPVAAVPGGEEQIIGDHGAAAAGADVVAHGPLVALDPAQGDAQGPVVPFDILQVPRRPALRLDGREPELGRARVHGLDLAAAAGREARRCQHRQNA